MVPHAKIARCACALAVLALISISSLAAQPEVRSLYIPVLQSMDYGVSKLALINPTLESTTVTLTARSYAGSLLQGGNIINPVSITLPASSTRSLTPKEVFGDWLSAGWVELQTTFSGVSGAFFVFDSKETAIEGTEVDPTRANGSVCA